MTFKALFLVSAAALTLAGCAQRPSVIAVGNGEARLNRTLNVMSGGSISGGFLSMVNPDCSSGGMHKVRVVQAPEQGTLDVAKTTNFPSFLPMNPRAKCNTQRVPGTQITYRAKSGYVGTDAYVLEIFAPNGILITDRVTVNVR